MNRWQLTSKLEGYVQPSLRPSRKPVLSQGLADLWYGLMDRLAVSNEPHIWSTRDSAGNLRWKAHDPLTNETTDAMTDAEMRQWLEERHYRLAV
ncbi:hypothetical protein ACQ4M4_17335 [Leptolyngbya sp. AN02str]|uniref:hypothetical protein n=1 Tax=Leptolyngbya sp. AN02str TaxID=3423363 RepID=UPI003D312955